MNTTNLDFKHQSNFSTAYSFLQHKFIQHLSLIGLCLIAISILYLLAANWFMLPKFIQLAIPQILLILSALAGFYWSRQHWLIQTFHSICGLMIGLSLAVIGQIYQTGADSYLLFLVWALLLLPWLYRPNIGVFALFILVSHLALSLFFSQTFWLERSQNGFIICLNIWSLLTFLISLKFYSSLRFLFLAWFAVLSFWSMIAFNIEYHLVLLFSALFLSSIAFGYFYLKKDQLCSSLSAMILGISLTIWLVYSVVNQSEFSTGSLLFLAIIIFAWFAIITALLIKLLPNSKFNTIPLAIGAWLAGLLLSSFVLVMWESISMLLGLVFMAVGLIILWRKTHVYFLRQLGYCLFISGQCAFLIHLGLFTKELYPLLLMQIIICLSLFFFRAHWFFWSVQLLAAYALAIAYIVFDGQHSSDVINSHALFWLLNMLIITSLFFVPRLEKQYQRSVIILVLFSLLGHSFLPLLNVISTTPIIESHTLRLLFYALPMVWLIAFTSLYLRQQFSIISLTVIFIFSLILLFYGYFDIFILLIVLSWALQNKDSPIYALTLFILTIILWFFYYSMDISFLSKSLMIFISGILLLLMGYMLSQQHRQGVAT